jgi:AP-1 complex subunit beta-1
MHLVNGAGYIFVDTKILVCRSVHPRYSDRIDNADELLDQFIGGFKDEDVQVQLQILTATVKLFLKKPAGNQELVQRVLGLCTQESDDPDLRDRGFIYWRLLLTDPNAAKAVVLCEKPLISEETDLLEPSLLDELLCHISSLAAVYHKPPSTFTETRADARRPLAGIEAVEEDLEIVGERPSAPMVDLLGGGGGSGAADLLGLGLGGGDTAAAAPSGYAGFKKPVTTWVTTAASSGLQITGTFGRANGNPVMEMTFSNQSSGQLSDFAVQFDKNSFKLINTAPLAVAPLAPGASCQVAMPINTSGQLGRQDPLNKLNIAFKATGLPTVTYMAVAVPYNVLLVEDGRLEKQPYLALWGEIAEETTNQLNGVPGSTDDIMARCRANNVFDVAKRNVAGNDVAYFSMRFVNGLDVLAELTMLGGGAVKVALKAKQPAVTGCAAQVFKDLLEPAPTQGLLF